jgi:hypothetical protein
MGHVREGMSCDTCHAMPVAQERAWQYGMSARHASYSAHRAHTASGL